MQTIMDKETGEPKVINDLTNAQFEVYAEIGQTYQTQKQQTRQELISVAASLDPNDPLRKIVTMKALELMDGIALDDVRKYIRSQMLIQGITEPETQEDVAILQKAQQQQQGKQDPATMIAQAEMAKAQAEQGKAQAANLREQRGFLRDKADIIIDRSKIQIDAYDAETRRNNVELEAAERGINLRNKTIEGQGKLLDNQLKAFDLEELQMDTEMNAMSDDELRQIAGVQ
jgi:hypothetical protein